MVWWFEGWCGGLNGGVVVCGEVWQFFGWEPKRIHQILQ